MRPRSTGSTTRRSRRRSRAALAAGFRQIKVKIGAAGRRRDRPRAASCAGSPATRSGSASTPTGPTTSTTRSGSAACSPISTTPGSRSRSAPRTGAAIAILREKLPIRLAAGESDFCAVDALDLLEDRSLGLIQPDVARARAASPRPGASPNSRRASTSPTRRMSAGRARSASRRACNSPPRPRTASPSNAWSTTTRCAQALLTTPVGDPADHGRRHVCRSPMAPASASTVDRDALAAHPDRALKPWPRWHRRTHGDSRAGPALRPAGPGSAGAPSS